MPREEEARLGEVRLHAGDEPQVVVVAGRLLRAVRAELGKTERLGQSDDVVVAPDVLRIDEIGVGIQADQVNVMAPA